MAYVVNVQNVATLEVYSSDPETDTTTYVTFNEFKTQVEKCKTVLESCILNAPSEKIIKIYLGWSSDPFISTDKTLGWAGEGTIAINQYNTGQYYLNDTQEHQNISVIIHEIIHVLGLFPSNISGNSLFTTKTDSLDGTVRRVYLGEKGLNGYKKVLLANNIKVPDPLYICIEDDFEEGTVNVHLEEAYNSSNDPHELITINGEYYPTLWNEIMTGLLDKDYNYITPITMGCLEDIGYTINYESQYIVTNGTNMKFMNDVKAEQIGTTANFLTFDEEQYNLKYLNKILKENNLVNKNVLINDIQLNWGEKMSR